MLKTPVGVPHTFAAFECVGEKGDAVQQSDE
jgi:hypothetical protein